MLRWKLTTDTQTITFRVNPKSMEAPELPYTANTAMPMTVIGQKYADSRAIVPYTVMTMTTGQAEPIPWTFSGTIYSLNDIEDLTAFLQEGQLQLTDHFGRNWRVILQDFDVRRAPWPHYPERHTYDMKCLMLGRLDA